MASRRWLLFVVGVEACTYSSTTFYVPYPAAVDGTSVFFSTGSAEILRVTK